MKLNLSKKDNYLFHLDSPNYWGNYRLSHYGFKEKKNKKKSEILFSFKFSTKIIYTFQLQFNRYFNRCTGHLKCEYKDITSLLKKLDNSIPYKTYVIDADLGAYIEDEKNEGTYLFSDTVMLKFDNTDESSVELLVENIYNRYFLEGVVKVIESTNSIVKINDLLNNNPSIVLDDSSVYFSNIQHKFCIALISSWLCDDRNKFKNLEIYFNFIKNETNIESNFSKLYFKLYDYFKNEGLYPTTF
ncbi:hypothetical protein [Flammeovirga sp. SJP92]|uniref:hypothetical protein n=1 Tax=Flammeovirga sp. SJP92 TaxID=1775430 RepID=UPI000787CFC6|nr:hypothetical protein [Flammeovirga sp. SJP92]KXX69244.1 hypothetical protein AVL50_16415 [Flammeovirga sp. SJP92]